MFSTDRLEKRMLCTASSVRRRRHTGKAFQLHYFHLFLFLRLSALKFHSAGYEINFPTDRPGWLGRQNVSTSHTHFHLKMWKWKNVHVTHILLFSHFQVKMSTFYGYNSDDVVYKLKKEAMEKFEAKLHLLIITFHQLKLAACWYLLCWLHFSAAFTPNGVVEGGDLRSRVTNRTGSIVWCWVACCAALLSDRWSDKWLAAVVWCRLRVIHWPKRAEPHCTRQVCSNDRRVWLTTKCSVIATEPYLV